jgi:uncharacterized protein
VPALILPIFPLPDVVLFPHTTLPLHVFEARYRAMVMDAVDRDGRLAIVKLEPGYEATYAGKPAVHAVAGAGRIVSSERLPTCRYDIVVRGECRIRITAEIPTDTLYRVVRAERLEDSAPAHEPSALLARIRGSCRRVLHAIGRPENLLDAAFAEGQPPGLVADRIAGAVVPGGALRQELLEMLDVEERLERLARALDDLVAGLRGER